MHEYGVLAMPEIGLGMWAYGVLALALVAASITDVREGKVRNVVTYPAVVIGLIGHTLVGGLGPGIDPDLGLLGSLSGLAVGFLPLLVAWLAGGIGGAQAHGIGAVGPFLARRPGGQHANAVNGLLRLPQ